MPIESRLGESLEAKEKAYLESQKLLFEVSKHLTTISTGSILILIAFLEKLFVSPEWKALVVVAFVGFLASIVGSIILMTMIASDTGSYSHEEVIGENLGLITFIITLLGFGLGIISLVVFAIKNFY